MKIPPILFFLLFWGIVSCNPPDGDSDDKSKKDLHVDNKETSSGAFPLTGGLGLTKLKQIGDGDNKKQMDNDLIQLFRRKGSDVIERNNPEKHLSPLGVLIINGLSLGERIINEIIGRIHQVIFELAIKQRMRNSLADQGGQIDTFKDGFILNTLFPSGIENEIDFQESTDKLKPIVTELIQLINNNQQTTNKEGQKSISSDTKKEADQIASDTVSRIKRALFENKVSNQKNSHNKNRIFNSHEIDNNWFFSDPLFGSRFLKNYNNPSKKKSNKIISQNSSNKNFQRNRYFNDYYKKENWNGRSVHQNKNKKKLTDRFNYEPDYLIYPEYRYRSGDKSDWSDWWYSNNRMKHTKSPEKEWSYRSEHPTYAYRTDTNHKTKEKSDRIKYGKGKHTKQKDSLISHNDRNKNRLGEHEKSSYGYNEYPLTFSFNSEYWLPSYERDYWRTNKSNKKSPENKEHKTKNKNNIQKWNQRSGENNNNYYQDSYQSYDDILGLFPLVITHSNKHYKPIIRNSTHKKSQEIEIPYHPGSEMYRGSYEEYPKNNFQSKQYENNKKGNDKKKSSPKMKENTSQDKKKEKKDNQVYDSYAESEDDIFNYFPLVLTPGSHNTRSLYRGNHKWGTHYSEIPAANDDENRKNEKEENWNNHRKSTKDNVNKKFDVSKDSSNKNYYDSYSNEYEWNNYNNRYDKEASNQYVDKSNHKNSISISRDHNSDKDVRYTEKNRKNEEKWKVSSKENVNIISHKKPYIQSHENEAYKETNNRKVGNEWGERDSSFNTKIKNPHMKLEKANLNSKDHNYENYVNKNLQSAKISQENNYVNEYESSTNSKDFSTSWIKNQNEVDNTWIRNKNQQKIDETELQHRDSNSLEVLKSHSDSYNENRNKKISSKVSGEKYSLFSTAEYKNHDADNKKYSSDGKSNILSNKFSSTLHTKIRDENKKDNAEADDNTKTTSTVLSQTVTKSAVDNDSKSKSVLNKEIGHEKDNKKLIPNSGEIKVDDKMDSHGFSTEELEWFISNISKNLKKHDNKKVISNSGDIKVGEKKGHDFSTETESPANKKSKTENCKEDASGKPIPTSEKIQIDHELSKQGMHRSKTELSKTEVIEKIINKKSIPNSGEIEVEDKTKLHNFSDHGSSSKIISKIKSTENNKVKDLDSNNKNKEDLLESSESSEENNKESEENSEESSENSEKTDLHTESKKLISKVKSSSESKSEEDENDFEIKIRELQRRKLMKNLSASSDASENSKSNKQNSKKSHVSSSSSLHNKYRENKFSSHNKHKKNGLYSSFSTESQNRGENKYSASLSNSKSAASKSINILSSIKNSVLQNDSREKQNKAESYKDRKTSLNNKNVKSEIQTADTKGIKNINRKLISRDDITDGKVKDKKIVDGQKTVSSKSKSGARSTVELNKNKKLIEIQNKKVSNTMSTSTYDTQNWSENSFTDNKLSRGKLLAQLSGISTQAVSKGFSNGGKTFNDNKTDKHSKFESLDRSINYLENYHNIKSHGNKFSNAEKQKEESTMENKNSEIYKKENHLFSKSESSSASTGASMTKTHKMKDARHRKQLNTHATNIFSVDKNENVIEKISSHASADAIANVETQNKKTPGTKEFGQLENTRGKANVDILNKDYLKKKHASNLENAINNRSENKELAEKSNSMKLRNISSKNEESSNKEFKSERNGSNEKSLTHLDQMKYENKEKYSTESHKKSNEDFNESKGWFYSSKFLSGNKKAINSESKEKLIKHSGLLHSNSAEAIYEKNKIDQRDQSKWSKESSASLSEYKDKKNKSLNNSHQKLSKESSSAFVEFTESNESENIRHRKRNDLSKNSKSSLSQSYSEFESNSSEVERNLSSEIIEKDINLKKKVSSESKSSSESESGDKTDEYQIYSTEKEGSDSEDIKSKNENKSETNTSSSSSESQSEDLSNMKNDYLDHYESFSRDTQDAAFNKKKYTNSIYQVSDSKQIKMTDKKMKNKSSHELDSVKFNDQIINKLDKKIDRLSNNKNNNMHPLNLNNGNRKFNSILTEDNNLNEQGYTSGNKFSGKNSQFLLEFPPIEPISKFAEITYSEEEDALTKTLLELSKINYHDDTKWHDHGLTSTKNIARSQNSIKSSDSELSSISRTKNKVAAKSTVTEDLMKPVIQANKKLDNNNKKSHIKKNVNKHHDGELRGDIELETEKNLTQDQKNKVNTSTSISLLKPPRKKLLIEIPESATVEYVGEIPEIADLSDKQDYENFFGSSAGLQDDKLNNTDTKKSSKEYKKENTGLHHEKFSKELLTNTLTKDNLISKNSLCEKEKSDLSKLDEKNPQQCNQEIPRTDIFIVRRTAHGPVGVTKIENRIPPLVTFRLIPRQIYEKIRTILGNNQLAHKH